MRTTPSFILESSTRLLFFAINVFAIYLLLRGHDLPGGGFIGGLVCGISFALLALALGPDEERRIFGGDPGRVAVWGVVLAAGTAAWPLLSNEPFFQHLHDKPELPLIGRVYLGTALLFDIGVFLTVVGISVKIILALFQSTRGDSAFLPQEMPHYALPSEMPIEEASPKAEPGAAESTRKKL